MKSVNIIIVVLLGLLASNDLSAQHHRSYDIVVNRLCSNGKTVEVEYTVNLDPSKVQSMESVLVQLYIEKNGRQAIINSFLLNGKQRRRLLDRAAVLRRTDNRVAVADYILSANDPAKNVFFADSMEYQEWMQGAALYTRDWIAGCGNCLFETTMELGVISIVPTIEVPEPPASVTEEKPEPAKEQLISERTAYFAFATNDTRLDLNLENNAYEWARVSEHIRQIQSEENGHNIKIEIIGFASPEGLYELNRRLSEGRARTISERLLSSDEFRLSPDQITVSYADEDWDGLIKLIRDSDLPYKQKVMDIIENTGVFNGREKAIMELAGGNVYRILLRDYFPKLRRTEYRISYLKETS